jgi:hypothetical protein
VGLLTVRSAPHRAAPHEHSRQAAAQQAGSDGDRGAREGFNHLGAAVGGVHEYARHGRSIECGSPLEEEVVLTPSWRQLRRRGAGWEARGENPAPTISKPRKVVNFHLPPPGQFSVAIDILIREVCLRLHRADGLHRKVGADRAEVSRGHSTGRDCSGALKDRTSSVTGESIGRWCTWRGRGGRDQ